MWNDESGKRDVHTTGFGIIDVSIGGGRQHWALVLDGREQAHLLMIHQASLVIYQCCRPGMMEGGKREVHTMDLCIIDVSIGGGWQHWAQ